MIDTSHITGDQDVECARSQGQSVTIKVHPWKTAYQPAPPPEGSSASPEKSHQLQNKCSKCRSVADSSGSNPKGHRKHTTTYTGILKQMCTLSCFHRLEIKRQALLARLGPSINLSWLQAFAHHLGTPWLGAFAPQPSLLSSWGSLPLFWGKLRPVRFHLN